MPPLSAVDTNMRTNKESNHRILFIGNSFTARNGLPDLIAQLAAAHGKSIEHHLISAGGASLRQHWNAGEALKVITLPMPPRTERDGRRLPASYANFYIGNTVVLLPVFDSPQDHRAISILKSCFQTRKIVPIDCRELVWGLGTFHCLTQQQPAV